MKDEKKTKEQLINELAKLRQKISALEASETDHMQAVEELKKSEAYIDAMGDALIVLNMQRQVTRFNKAAMELLGYSQGEVPNLTFEKLFKEKEYEKHYAEMKRAVETGNVRDFETYLLKKDGKEVPVLLSGTAMRDTKGEPIGFVGVCKDITERKQIEKSLIIKDSSIKSAINPIALASLEGNITYVNPSFLKQWGYDNEEEVLGRPAISFWQKEESAQEIVNALHDKGAWEGELVARKKDDSFFDVQLSANMVTDNVGKPICMMASFIDITKRKLAEETLKDSEAKWRSITEHSPDHIMLLDCDAKIMFINRTVADLTMKEVIGKSVHEFTPPEAHKVADDCFKYVFETGKSATYNTEYHTKDGKVRYFEVRIGPVFRSGKVVALVSSSTDITEHKQADEKLIMEKTKLEHLLKSSPAVLYNCRIEGDRFVPVFASSNIKDIFGYEVDSYLKDPNWWIDHVHPEDKGRILSNFSSILFKQGHLSHEYRFQHSNGTYSWVHDKLRLVQDQEGNPVEIIGAWIDITKRKQAEKATKESEERLQSILDNSTTVVYVKNLQGKYILINHRFETLFHIDRNEIIGKIDHDIFPKEMADAFRANDLKVIKANVPIEFDEIAPHDDGPHSYISIKFPLFDSTGKLYAVCGISTDITERKRMEVDLKDKSQELMELNEELRNLSFHLSKEEELSRRRFASVLHDQIGQNLAAIKMRFSGIQDGTLSDWSEVKETASYISPLLDATIRSTRELTSDLYPTILDDLGFKPAVEWYRELVLNTKGTNVLLDIDKSVEDFSSDIKLSLFRIIQEAFQNIRKHALAKKIKVSLGVMDNSVKLSVKDNGVGFNLEKNKARIRKGIGLKLIKERVLSLEGSFKVESTPGKGTELIVEIPVTR